MKKLLLVFLLSLLACTDEEPVFNWEFTVTKTTSVTTNLVGYPNTVTTVFSKYKLTEDEAQRVVDDNTMTVSQPYSNVGIYGWGMITTKTNCVKKKK